MRLAAGLSLSIKGKRLIGLISIYMYKLSVKINYCGVKATYKLNLTLGSVHFLSAITPLYDNKKHVGVGVGHVLDPH